MTAVAPSGMFARGVTASVVTGMSLASRVLALLLLVPAARLLSTSDFGVFSLALGLAIAVANVVGGAPADLTATAAASAPRHTWLRVTRIVAALTLVEVALIVAVPFASAQGAVVLLSGVVSLTAIGPVLAMNVLRGLDRPVVGAALPYVVLPVARGLVAVAALSAGTDLVGLLTVLAGAGAVVGMLTVVVLFVTRPTAETGAVVTVPSTRRASRPLLAVVAGASVSIAWLTIGQSSSVALSAVAGPAVLAAFVPTARLCDSLTAIGIGYKAAANRGLQQTRDGSLPARALIGILGSFAVASCLVFAVAPIAVPAVFGADLHFLGGPAVALLGAAALSSLVAVKIQLLFALRRYQRIAGASALACVVAVVGTGAAAAAWQTTGVAAAALVTAAAWLVALTALPSRSAGTPC
ncbi:hypothetical protein [Curtobacterium sp. MCBA15_008]|uniref:hypothetical protein n=1 Tax=Curtobacterium sp. MCBA15_008 TaxID=1898736 RepID=UPI0008DE47E3|nr:hypothetical protein [Curtobacterium sp. MCBA15_008]OII09024.1 hypothetical protein BIU96_03735 [Curtobacterium sp. MCBA15_008]